MWVELRNVMMIGAGSMAIIGEDDYRNFLNIQQLCRRLHMKIITAEMNRKKKFTMTIEINEYFSLRYILLISETMDTIPYHEAIRYELDTQIYQPFFNQFSIKQKQQHERIRSSYPR